MAEHKTEIDLSIGGNAEKKLNDFIDKANQLGEQLNKISGIEIGGNVDTSSLKEFEKHLEAIQKKTNRMDSINILNSKDMKQQMSHLESYERNLDRIRKEFYSLPEGSMSSVTASGYKGIIDKYSNGIVELQEKIQSFESNITATKELLSKSIKNGGIANLLNSDEDLSSRRNYNKLTRSKRYVSSLQNQDPDNFFDTKSIIEAGKQFSKKIQPLIDMLSNKSFDDSAFEAMRSNLESIGVSADNLKKKLQDMFKVEQQGVGGSVSSPTTPTTSAGRGNSGGSGNGKGSDDSVNKNLRERIKLLNELIPLLNQKENLSLEPDKNTASLENTNKEIADRIEKLQKLNEAYKDLKAQGLAEDFDSSSKIASAIEKNISKLRADRSSRKDFISNQNKAAQDEKDSFTKTLLSRYDKDEINSLSEATGKIEAYASAVEEAKKKYQGLIEYTDSHDMSSKDNQTAADKLANNLDKTLKDLGSEKFDSFNTKGSFFKSFSGNLADVRQEVNKLLSGYEEIDQATIKWSTNQKSLTYVMQDTDGIMKKFRLNLEKTADGFNARTVELGKQNGFDKLGDMISNGFSAGANGITKVVDMYASVQDMINYAKQGIDVFKEYDAALTDISYTTEGTKEQISAMGKSYVQLAKDMSTSVEDSMKVASIYANLQTSSEEVMQSVKPTLLLANATGVDASSASDQIQGILEQFDIGTDQAEHVVDVLENVSSNLKEDFGKAINNVTEGISAVGQTAADAGFTFEQLAAMIGKVSEKTRDSGSEIGNSLKTMLTRISKASSLTDEVDNETISKAAKSLHEVGVEVYEQDGTFRNFLTILSELKEKWNDLSDSQQADDFAWVFGNKYQRTYLIAGNALESCTTIIRKLDYEGLTTQELAVHATKLLSAA